ncbi:hypothetical protein [Rudanella lutea]|uniref:hypothetical protein n=1 Tax=Rudanella lutea TaxID=451374 RepID=UPI00037E4E0F|nr:hypothetical protein [Rudanella lutea]
MKSWILIAGLCLLAGALQAKNGVLHQAVSTTLVAAEYFWNTDPGVGAATALSLPPGVHVDALLSIPTGTLPQGANFLGVRVRAANGQWSPTRLNMVYMHAPGTSGDQTVLTAIEYFINTDQGLGNNTILPISPTSGSTPVVVSVPLPATLAVGTHQIGVRTRTGRGQWSQTMLSPLVIFAGQTANAISRVEYFIDTDPGYGQATALPFTPANGQDVAVTGSTSLSALGSYSFFFRARDTNNRWSALYYVPVNSTLTGCLVQQTLRSGNWNDPTIWSCGSVPTGTQDVLIKTGHTITVLSPMGRQVCRNLRFETGGKLMNGGVLGLGQP